MTDETSATTENPWGPFRFFLGRWTGIGSGKPGESRAERNYELVLNDQFIQIKHRSVYEPQEQNPKGEVHEEIGYISFDRSRQTYVLREFHVEGYVNQYVLEEMDQDGHKMIMRTEAIENIPPGWQARTTYELLGEDEFRETFELAGPGQAWSCYITNVFKRTQGSKF